MKYLISFCFSFFCFMSMSANAQVAPNWTPSIFVNGESYMITFQHKTGNLKYYTAVENIQIDGKMTMATVVRFSPNITNAGNPLQLSTGFMVSPTIFGFAQTVNLTGQVGGQAIQVEIYEGGIDPTMPGSVGNPQGKGTMVATRPNVGSGVNARDAAAPQAPGGLVEPRRN